eukprot:1642739-Amphidinium_carterae.2
MRANEKRVRMKQHHDEVFNVMHKHIRSLCNMCHLDSSSAWPTISNLDTFDENLTKHEPESLQ